MFNLDILIISTRRNVTRFKRRVAIFGTTAGGWQALHEQVFFLITWNRR
ncbi:hypothetical protein [Citrobacter phage Tr1]|nr:hypothetical protein [Citrobacter phage Tr1]